MAGTWDIITHRAQELLVNCTTSFGYKLSSQLALTCQLFSIPSPHQQATGFCTPCAARGISGAARAQDNPSLSSSSQLTPVPAAGPPLSASFPHVHVAAPDHPHPCPSPPAPLAPIHPPPALTHSPPFTTMHPARLRHPHRPESQGEVSALHFRERQQNSVDP